MNHELLPGPQFVSRPGWGGQLRQWFDANLFAVLSRFVLLLVLIVVAHAFFAGRATPIPEKSPTPSPEPAPLEMIAYPGDGMTAVAARALDVYLAVNASHPLDPAQHLFAVDALARTITWHPLEKNQRITFFPRTLDDIIARALTLSPAQHAAWARLLK